MSISFWRGFPVVEVFTPARHQPRMRRHIVETPHCALWLDMGAGKTATTLWAVTELIASLDVSRVLVVAPKRVALNTWRNEISRWDRFNHLTYRGITAEDFEFKREEVEVKRKGRKTKVKKLVPKADPASFDTGEQITTVSRDMLPHLVTFLGKKAWRWDMVVIDEASGFRDSNSQRFKAARVLRKHGLMPRLVELAGTPRPKSIENLWAQVYLLDEGQRLGRTLTAFRQQYMVPGKQGRDANGRTQIFDWTPRPGAEAEIFAKVSDICVSLLDEDLVQLPERTINPISVQMPPEALKAYRKMERDMLVPLAASDAVASNRATLVGKLLQMAGGNVFDEHGKGHTIHSAKLDALEEIVESLDGAPLLLAYWFSHEKQAIKARFPQAVEISDSDDTEARWNAGEISILLLHPAQGAHGLNLQFNDGHGCWYGPIHDLELWLQWNKRLHRPGRKTPVSIHVLLAEDTIDRAVLEAMDPKYEGQDRLLRAVRLRMEGT